MTYSRVGNRVTSVVGSATDTYTYPNTSNRLSGINLAAGGTRAYTYDAAGRMASMSINGVLQGTYKYDFAGRQAIRTTTSPAITIHSVFDSEGRPIAEYNQATGALIREYVWLGWEPVAVIEGGVTNLIRTDHIGRPVFATNTSGVRTWTASYTPFGGVRTTTGTPISARFPGQWFQEESGLHQNWMRDYDPTTGRYLEADPLGLVDGASVYGYAGQNPLTFTDPRGECLEDACVVEGIIVATVVRGVARWLVRKFTAEVVSTAATTVYSEITREQEKERGAERKAYKRFCENPPPPTGNLCQDLMTEISHVQQCIAMREAFSNKWYGGADSSHLGHIQELRNRIDRLQGEMSIACPELCPLIPENDGSAP